MFLYHNIQEAISEITHQAERERKELHVFHMRERIRILSRIKHFNFNYNMVADIEPK